MKNNNLVARLLRFGVFAVLLAGSATAALMPDWATTLKAQGYASYVDLLLDVRSSAPVLNAGMNADLLVTLSNAGPADANGARTVASLNGDAIATATSGCMEDPLGFPDCRLSTPLPAGASADYLMTLAVSPLARGYLKVVVAAESDELEIAQELVFVKLPIEAHVDLSASATCDRSYMRTTAPLSCQLVLSNAGPAAVKVPYLYVNANGTTVANQSCSAPRQDMCPGPFPVAWAPRTIMPGDSISLSFQLTVNSPLPLETIYLDSGAFITSGGEIDDAPSTNWISRAISVPLFRDDFEGL